MRALEVNRGVAGKPTTTTASLRWKQRRENAAILAGWNNMIGCNGTCVASGQPSNKFITRRHYRPCMLKAQSCVMELWAGKRIAKVQSCGATMSCMSCQHAHTTCPAESDVHFIIHPDASAMATSKHMLQASQHCFTSTVSQMPSWLRKKAR